VTAERAKPPPPGATVRSAPSRAAAWRATLRQARILALLLVLLVVSVTTCRSHYLSTRWRVPLYVAIYPIAADASPVTRAYVAALDAERFDPIDRFFGREAKRYGVAIDSPVKTRLRPPLADHPPQRAPDASILATALWSLNCATGPGARATTSRSPRTSACSCSTTIRP
jgi:hypothetical protein